ncbi:hypothetical protein LP419_31370 [Massilia sp. H-1]|nr:hypothetical protein LP419_31370 [Massilia sp. H-1]
MKKAIAAVLITTAMGVGLAAFSRGPVGPESIVHIEVPMFISDAAESLHATAAGPLSVEAATVPLSGMLDAKRALKVALSQIGMSYPVAEFAEQYTFEHGKVQSSVRCLIRFRGDHVISVALGQNAPMELKQAIRSRFPGYIIHEIRA